jgi:MerR family transcriptional regulator, copper efflux regulator
MPSRVASPAVPAAPLSTAALCAAAGVTRGTLRLYEREGLVAPARRTPAGYRQYGSDAVVRLQAIRHLKEVGFSLREIGLLLVEHGQGAGLTPARLRKIARDQLLAIDQRIARLQVVRELIAAVAAGDRSVLDDPECRFLMDFLAAGERQAAALSG